MNKLKELATELGTRHLFYDNKSVVGKRAGLLYTYLQRTATPTKAGAAAVLSCAPGSIIVRRSVDQLEKILLDNLLMVRPGDITSDDPEVVKRYVWKLIGVGAGQIMNVYSPVVIPFLEEAFELAEANGLISAAKVSSNFLAMRTVNPVLDAEKYSCYQEKSIYYEQLFLEYELIRLFFQEIDNGAPTVITPSDTLHRLKQLKAQTFRAHERFGHPRLALTLRYLTLKICYLEEDHTRTIQAAKEAIEWARSGPAYLKREAIGFALILSQTYLVADDFVHGKEYLNDLLLQPQLPLAARTKLLETVSLLCLRTGHYSEAIRRLSELSQWNKLNALDQTTELAFRTYLWLLGRLALLGDVPEENHRWMSYKSVSAVLPEQRLHGNEQLLNHYLLISIIFFLNERKYSSAKKAFDAIRRPTRSTDPRYKTFFKLLEALFAQGLHRIAVERHAKPLAKKLAQLPATPESITAYVEIIPFEVLWRMISVVLPSKRIKLK